MNNPDVFIPAHPKDFAVLPKCIRTAWKYLRPTPGRIVIIAAEPSKSDLRLWQRLGAEHLPEASVPEIPPISEMPEIISANLHRTGWYYQQFVKFAVRRLSRSQRFLILDADTVFIRPVEYIRDDKLVFHRTEQFHVPYFVTFEKLLGYRPEREPSFIINYMTFDVPLLDELISRIESRFGGQRWFQAVLDSIDRTQPSSFSEFETFGYFLSRYHADKYVSVTGRNAIRMSDKAWAHPIYRHVDYRRGYDSISYHCWAKPLDRAHS